MARITVEDCLEHESNRFALVRLASRRAKQLLAGRTPVADIKGNKAVVLALREIADGKVRFRRPVAVVTTNGATRPKSKSSAKGKGSASAKSKSSSH